MRKSIYRRIQRKNKRIAVLMNEIIDLQYSEELRKAKKIEDTEVNVGSKKEPHIVPAKRMYWDEIFFDEDRPKDKKHAVTVERSKLIEIDGQKTDGWHKLPYYESL